MRKIYFSISFIAVCISLVSLSNQITETRKPAIQSIATGPCLNNELSKSSSNDACRGCHGSATSVGPNDYVIIIYANGKTGSGLKLYNGVNNLMIYTPDINSETLTRQLIDEGMDVTVAPKVDQNFDIDKFTAIHGAQSSTILNNISHIKAVTKEDVVINISNAVHTIDFTTLFNNTSMQLNVNSTKSLMVQVSLFDLTGKAFIQNAKASINEGETQVIFDSNMPLSRGIYIVKIVDEFGKVTTKKVFID